MADHDVRKLAVANLTDEWRSSAEIHKAMGCWSSSSVADQLRVAALNGEAEAMKDQIPSGFRWLYRKPQCKET